MQRSQNKKQWFWNVQTVKSPIRFQSIIEREHGVIWGAHHHYVFVLVKEILIHMSDGNQCATNKTLLFRVLKGCYYTPCYMDCFNKWNVNSVPNQPGVHGMIYSFSFFLVHVKMKQICIPSCGEAPNHKWMQKVAMSCDITQQRCFLELWNLSGMLTIRVSQHEQTKNAWHMTESPWKSHIMKCMSCFSINVSSASFFSPLGLLKSMFL